MDFEKKLSYDLNKAIDDINPDVWNKIKYAKIKRVSPLHKRKQWLIRPIALFITIFISLSLMLNENSITNIILLNRTCVLAADYPNSDEDIVVDKEFIDAVNSFALKTASALLSDTDKNANYSPISLYFALSMIAVGSNGETLDEFLDVLGISGKDKNYLSEQAEKLYRDLYFDNDPEKLIIANSLWLSDKAKFKESYISTIRQYFYSSLFNVDFKDPTTSGVISKWVAKNTNYTIEPEINTDATSLLELASTIAYHDDWVKEFVEVNQESFTLKNDNEIICDFMKDVKESTYVKGDSFLRSSLSFKSGANMLFVLPAPGVDVSDLLKSPKILEEALLGGQTKTDHILYKIPKFSFKASFNLNETLKSAGLKSIFDKADFSDITETLPESLFIRKATQETYITLCEKGVRAKSYTGIDMNCFSDGMVDLVLNRPFIYAITAKDGTILFIGVCMNPNEG